ncbi:MAG: nucleoside deaminase [Planctomycetales bacterium]
MMIDHAQSMRLVIARARETAELPFAAAVIHWSSGEVLAMCGNRTPESPVWHAEILAIRETSERHPSVDWQQCALYSTAEPCPMCQSAILWAGLQAVIYGTSIPYLQTHGWWQIPIRAAEVIARSPGRSCRLIGGILEDECNALFSATGRTL